MTIVKLTLCLSGKKSRRKLFKYVSFSLLRVIHTIQERYSRTFLLFDLPSKSISNESKKL